MVSISLAFSDVAEDSTVNLSAKSSAFLFRSTRCVTPGVKFFKKLLSLSALVFIEKAFSFPSFIMAKARSNHCSSSATESSLYPVSLKFNNCKYT